MLIILVVWILNVFQEVEPMAKAMPLVCERAPSLMEGSTGLLSPW